MRHRGLDRRFFYPILLICAILEFAGHSLLAAQNYFTRTWQVEQGLPHNKVTALVQTADGYLWVGTYRGLARFDGVEFTTFDDNNTPELRSSRITSLYESPDRALWIGTESGDVSRYKDGHFTRVPLHPNWATPRIYAITGDNAGDVWLMNAIGQLARARDSAVVTPPAGLVTNVFSLARGNDGTIWVGREGLVSRIDGGHIFPDFSTNDYVQGIAAGRDGGLWVARNGGIRKWKDGQWTTDLGAAPWNYGIVSTFIETSQGILAAGTSDSGLWLLFPHQTNTPPLHFDRSSGLPSDWVISLWEDNEKSLWCGTGGGLVVLRASNLETLSPPDKWKDRAVLSVLAAPDGRLWVGTEGAGLYRFEDGRWTNFNTSQGLANVYVWSLAADDGGNIWAGTWGGGLFTQYNDKFDRATHLEDFRTPIPALLYSDGELWMGTTAGALRYRKDSVKRFDEAAGEPFGDVRAIERSPSGALWFGTAGSGLVVCETNGSFHRFKKADGLTSDFIECLRFAKDGALWIGTFGGGLNRLKNGKFSAINQAQGLPNGIIGDIEADGLGYFWMGSYGGILRVSEKDLNRCADGEIPDVAFLTYGVNDGLPTLECSEGLQPAGGRMADGRILFSTAKGLVAVDPAGVKTNPLPPSVQIEELRLDDKPFADGAASSPLEIPPGTHRIAFKYTALSFIAPEKMQFKCRLRDIDTDWVNVGSKRIATYNYIAPGRYSFQVTACNNDGVWNQTGATIAFKVLPYFWQTTWFDIVGGILTVLAASGAVWFDTRRRMRRRLERVERQRDIERERSRIARDIHDDLGAQLTRITMISDPTRAEATNPESATAGLRRIYDTARELTRSMDEIVWAVNPRHDTLESLATYLEKFGHDWLAGVGIRCRLDLPLQFPEWHISSEVRHNVFLAFKEALHNAVKHSGASEVLIRLSLCEKSFKIAVEDNGRGFEAGDTIAAPASSGRAAPGNGFENMKQRLQSIGGSCTIESARGSGTKIVFTLPLMARTVRETDR
jgi:signal transduction histidine kinase/ligand-binding sensor domain-containing protein